MARVDERSLDESSAGPVTAAASAGNDYGTRQRKVAGLYRRMGRALHVWGIADASAGYHYDPERSERSVAELNRCIDGLRDVVAGNTT